MWRRLAVTISNELGRALFAMHAPNRGANRKLEVEGERLGNADIAIDELDQSAIRHGEWADAGFEAPFPRHRGDGVFDELQRRSVGGQLQRWHGRTAELGLPAGLGAYGELGAIAADLSTAISSVARLWVAVVPEPSVCALWSLGPGNGWPGRLGCRRRRRCAQPGALTRRQKLWHNHGLFRLRAGA